MTYEKFSDLWTLFWVVMSYALAALVGWPCAHGFVVGLIISNLLWKRVNGVRDGR